MLHIRQTCPAAPGQPGCAGTQLWLLQLDILGQGQSVFSEFFHRIPVCSMAGLEFRAARKVRH